MSALKTQLYKLLPRKLIRRTIQRGLEFNLQSVTFNCRILFCNGNDIKLSFEGFKEWAPLKNKETGEIRIIGYGKTVSGDWALYDDHAYNKPFATRLFRNEQRAINEFEFYKKYWTRHLYIELELIDGEWKPVNGK